MSQKISFNCTQNLVDLLGQSGNSIVFSTYKSNMLITVGVYNNALDIRYRTFPKPMGMYVSQGKLWAGLGRGIWSFCNFNRAGSQVSGERQFDACYLPVDIHFTADIDIHEMEYCSDDLYFLNTKFSCLCVANKNSSFKPVWKPPFITSLQPTDKCHLNGFCARDDKPRYVTALGIEDDPAGWRKNKANGGILMDIATNEVLCKGLSMPHSPRWHQERLWFLESGKGSLSYYDFKTEKAVEVVQIPGFTRGIQFVGNLAFIGVSTIRKSATFSGLPITNVAKRVCGVWVVDIAKGEIVSFIEFTQGIEEIFAVCVLPHSNMEIFGHDDAVSQSSYIVEDCDFATINIPEATVESAVSLFQKGAELYNENKLVEAIEEYKKALQTQPDYMPASFNMAVALGDLDRFDEAEKVMLDVIEQDAAMAEAYNSLGYICYKRGDFEKAKINFERAIELQPDYQQAINSLRLLEEQVVS
jgi:uncharacterized protein (TIGR03032 family)